MSERKGHDVDSERSLVAEREPEVGKGARNLSYWESLARARHSVAASRENADAFRLDPAAFLQRFGVEVGAVGGVDMASLALGFDPSQVLAQADAQLAFCKVWGVVIVNAVATAVIDNAVVLSQVQTNVNQIVQVVALLMPNVVANANSDTAVNVNAWANVNVNGMGGD